MQYNPIPYLKKASQPWITYNLYKNILNRSRKEEKLFKLKEVMLNSKLIQESLELGKNWEKSVLKRHNDATHPIHHLEILVEFGLTKDNPDVLGICQTILAHQTEEGAFQTLLLIPKRFKGTGEADWGWMACDIPILIYFLCNMGFQDDVRVRKAVDHLTGLIQDNGLRCYSSIPKFRGPDRKGDHCPYANLLALKALARYSDNKHIRDTCSNAIQAQLDFWKNRTQRKIYLFGIGTDFQKLKYPNIYYNIIHVLDVLSLFQEAKESSHFHEMLTIVNNKQSEDGSFVPESVWRAFKMYDFGQKKISSPTLTYKITEINNRCNKFLDKWFEG
jgi:hypothetical protein